MKVLTLILIIAHCTMSVVPVLGGDFLGPDNLGVADAWLTSSPQPAVKYHVFRACVNEGMTIDCTRCIYKANDDGSIWIPAENRCIYRVSEDNYTLYYQVQAVDNFGRESNWTQATPVLIERSIVDFFAQGYICSKLKNTITYALPEGPGLE